MRYGFIGVEVSDIVTGGEIFLCAGEKGAEMNGSTPSPTRFGLLFYQEMWAPIYGLWLMDWSLGKRRNFSLGKIAQMPKSTETPLTQVA